MELNLIPVTPENRDQIEKLGVFDSQSHYIETVKECMKEADELKLWHPLGIRYGNAFVGFAMYGYFSKSEDGKLWFDRFLIDKKYQHHGFGKAAIRQIVGLMHSQYPEEDIYLSVYDDNQMAIELYQSFGFTFTGGLDINGEKVMSLKSGILAERV